MVVNLKRILLVEDSPHDVKLTLAALKAGHLLNEVVVTRDGEEALDYLYRRGAYAKRDEALPAVILLDLKLPKVTGLEVLEQLRKDPNLRRLPVVMLTSSNDEKDLVRSYDLGVNAYVVKPVNTEDFHRAVQEIGLFWGVINAPAPDVEMQSAVRIVHLEDSDLDAKLIRSELTAAGVRVEIRRFDARDSFVEELKQQCCDLILADFNLPQFDGLSALKIAREVCPDIPFIIVSGAVGEMAAVEILKAGATDYVLKNRLERLGPSVHRALREADERRERRQAMQLLRESEERFQIALKNSPITVYSTDRELRYTWVHNIPAVFADVDMIGKRDDEFLPREDVIELMAFKARVLQSGQGGRREISIHYKGAESCFDVTAEPLRDANGKIIGITAAAMDITQRKQAEGEMRKARDLAEAANKAKDQFLAVLSHELRTPLSPVLLTVAAMEGDRSLTQQAREDIEMIRRNVELEARLIDDLLDLSRIATGKLALHREAAQAHTLLARVLEICRGDFTAKHLDITTNFAAVNDRLHADPARMQQVMWNVVKNAIKFTPPRGKISIATENPSAEEIEIRVTDNGAGIPPEILTRIFDAFEQGDPTITRQFGGLGLGLAISKAVVDLHGGSIRAHSAGMGKGAVFTIRLKCAKAAKPAEIAPPATKPSAHKVLLVEDHVDTANTLARLLKLSGCEVKIAHDLAEALAAMDAERFDVVVSDLGLPDGSGHDLIREIKKRHGTKGIALSGYGMDADLAASREAGFSEHLVKPVTGEQLEASIKRVMEENSVG